MYGKFPITFIHLFFASPRKVPSSPLYTTPSLCRFFHRPGLADEGRRGGRDVDEADFVSMENPSHKRKMKSGKILPIIFIFFASSSTPSICER